MTNPCDAFVGGRRVPPSPESTEEAVTRAVAAMTQLKRLSGADRAAILDRAAARLQAGAESLATTLADESGTLSRQDMVLEVQRAIDVCTLSAAAARTGFGEMVNLEGSPRGRDTLAFSRRVPYGPMLGITAFNGPLLIPAHKVAPAIVAGASVVLKPAPAVPRAAVAFAELIVAAGWPADALSVLPVDNDATMDLVRDPRLPMISFTGGEIGWTIKDLVPRKHVHLELGGVGAVIVAADADLDEAAEQCVVGGFVRSGQACLGVQRIYVERSAYEDLTRRLAERVAALRVGDPSDPETDVGPLVREEAAERVTAMIEEAVAAGATARVGGGRQAAVVTPTLLADTTSEMEVMRREVFGPVIAVAPVADLDEAVRETNAVGGALHVGIFTQDIDVALGLADELDAGGVIINGACAWRIDNMPYGGTGTSGFGREGVRAMVEEITERQVIAIRRRRGSRTPLSQQRA